MKSSSFLKNVLPMLALICGAFVLGRITALQHGESIVVKPPEPPSSKSSVRQIVSEHVEIQTVPHSDRAGAITSSQASAALKQLDLTIGCERREDDRLKLLIAWAATDPLAALDYARQNLKGDRLTQAASGIATQWAKNDPVGAWSWARSNNLSQAHTVLEEVSKNDPALALKLVSGFLQDDPNEAVAMCITAMRGMTYGGNYAGALKLANEAPLHSQEEQALLFNFMAGQWARFDPQKTAEWVNTLPDGIARNQGLVALGASWAELDAPKAAEFAAQLPAGQERQTALRQAIASWVLTDPVAASTWINKAGNHDDFDQAVATVATMQFLVEQQVGTALSWAETISNPSLRQATLGEIINNWALHDRAAALKYVQTSSGLSVEARERITREIQPGSQPSAAQ